MDGSDTMNSLFRRGVFAACGVAIMTSLSLPAAAERYPSSGVSQFETARPDGVAARKRAKARRESGRIDKPQPPAGPLQIVVSIARQRAVLYAKGVRIAEAPVSTGVPGHPTPTGVFSVISKSRYHKSNIYSGAPMPYMHRITWSGIALHHGPLPGYPASHGCIRLPEAFAARLWAISRIGMSVIVAREEAVPASIDNARLFVPRKLAADDGAKAVPTLASNAGQGEAPAGAADILKGLESPPPPPAVSAPKRTEPVQVFVSRKEAKLYVRQGFAAVFEAPVTIAEPEKPWGTHVFTVMDIKDDKAAWSALTIASGYVHRREPLGRKAAQTKEAERQRKRAAELAAAPPAAQALERFEIPQEAAARISDLLAVGSALIVSDNALSDETGTETGFIVLTP